MIHEAPAQSIQTFGQDLFNQIREALPGTAVLTATSSMTVPKELEHSVQISVYFNIAPGWRGIVTVAENAWAPGFRWVASLWQTSSPQERVRQSHTEDPEGLMHLCRSVFTDLPSPP